MLISCPDCGSENDARRRFCNACSASLERHCPCCGFGNRVGDSYCGGCGIRLEIAGREGQQAVQPVNLRVATVPAEASLDEAKRDELRTITIMMADLEGFAEMTELLGRDRQTEVMNEVLERLAQQHIVAEFDGYIDKFMDGDIMALFGAPIAHEDAPERAVRAAVRMHEELERMHEEGRVPAETPLRLRIGLNTGPVRVGGVGAGGRMEYTAMGDTVNLSARLMTACDWGGTLISVNTHRRVQGSFEIEELPSIKVKGKSEPVQIWAVIAEKRRAARLELAEQAGMARLVGRDDEFAAARDALQQAQAGLAQAVGIRGEAGIGKSRLVYEMRQSASALDPHFFEGRCLSYGSSLAYLPVREVIEQAVGITDRDSVAERRDKVRDRLATLGLDADRHAAALGAVLSVDFADEDFSGLEPQERRNRIREAFLALLTSLAREQLTLVFFDDLQWCDADSLELIDEVVRQADDASLLLLLAYRPDFQHDWSDLPRFRLVEPRRLDREQVRAMVGSLLARRELIEDETRIDDSLADGVYVKSQGNPFFVDQTVTALVDRARQTGRPTIDYRRGRLLLQLDELDDLVPDSVEEILLARIDKLPAGPRDLLQAASVSMIGRYFRRSALEFVRDDPSLEQELGVLQARDLIRLENRSDDDEEYVFEHALARDVAYNALLRSERRRLHGLVGEYIEDHYATSLEAYVDDLSYHYYNSAKPLRALVYLPQSADRAFQRYANQQSIMHYKRALEKLEEAQATPDAPDDLRLRRLDVLKGLCFVQSLIADREIIDYGQQRLDLARELDDAETVIDASFMLARANTEIGEFAAARLYWDQVLSEYERAGTWDGVRDTEYGIGNLCYLQGNYEGALEHFQRALAIQQEHLEFDPFSLWIAHNNLAAAYETTGRFEQMLEACRTCEELLSHLAESDPLRPRLESYTLGNLGSAHRNLGQLTEALTSYQRCLANVQKTGEKNVEAEVRYWLGRTYLLTGRLIDARQHLDESLALALESGHSRWEAGSLAALAEVHLARGELTASRGLVEQAREVLQRVGQIAGDAEVSVAAARLALAEARPATAVELLTAIAADEPASAEDAAVLVVLAEAHLAAEQADDARDRLTVAQQIAEALHLRVVALQAACLTAILEPDDATAAANLAACLDEAAALGLAEWQIRALAARAERLATTDPAAARSTLAAADELLTTQLESAGEAFVTFARTRFLTPTAQRLPAS